jgi:hypothetical protein
MGWKSGLVVEQTQIQLIGTRILFKSLSTKAKQWGKWHVTCCPVSRTISSNIGVPLLNDRLSPGVERLAIASHNDNWQLGTQLTES